MVKYIHTVTQNINGLSSIETQIACPFPVKTVSVNVVYYQNNAEAGLSFLTLQNLVKNTNSAVVAWFADRATPNSINNVFEVAQPIVSGTYTFNIVNAANAPKATGTGDLYIQLIFSD